MKVVILPGDGVGPEVVNEAAKVLRVVCDTHSLPLSVEYASVGGAALREAGSPLPAETAEACLAADAVILGAVGDPEFDHVLPEHRPESGLLALRKLLGGFANLRPSRAVPALLSSSPLRREIFEGTDLLIVRELLGGLYFGEPRGIRDDGNEAFNTMVYTRDEVRRVARIAFKAAAGRRQRLTSVDKANVLETSRLWRETVDDVAAEFPGVEVEHLYVDACAMHLVTDPRRFDVLLTENMFGDILSDEAAVLTGSIGMLASATIGGRVDLYEPVHGSAPDIAGLGVANPIGAIASAAMMLRETFRQTAAADCIEMGIDRALDEGFRTRDISGAGNETLVSTSEMGDLVAERSMEMSNLSFAYYAV